MMEDRILDALGSTRDSWIAEAAALEGKRSFRLRRWTALAACFVLIFSIAVTAEGSSGSVSNLLAPLFGMALTEIVDGIGRPVGVSATAEGYTLTADAIIGDRYNVAIVFTLSREDGGPLPEAGRLQFKEREYFGRRGSGGGYWTASQRGEDPGKVSFVYCWKSEAKQLGRYWGACFSQLVLEGEDGQEQLLAEGPWELEFTMRYQDSSVKLPLKNLEVTMPLGTVCLVKRILLSPVGISLDMKVRNYQKADFGKFTVTLRMKDGTLFSKEGGQSGHFNLEDGTGRIAFRHMFEEPILVEDVVALILCGQEFALE